MSRSSTSSSSFPVASHLRYFSRLSTSVGSAPSPCQTKPGGKQAAVARLSSSKTSGTSFEIVAETLRVSDFAGCNSSCSSSSSSRASDLPSESAPRLPRLLLDSARPVPWRPLEGLRPRLPRLPRLSLEEVRTTLCEAPRPWLDLEVIRRTFASPRADPGDSGAFFSPRRMHFKTRCHFSRTDAVRSWIQPLQFLCLFFRASSCAASCTTCPQSDAGSSGSYRSASSS
mmetsp:Transcript_74058/g.102932  ORF Transcript_74058/g.102932 Transcript_74058/m.102932 type:complete len:228 (+) Transcript_74058:403-1086(+)